VSIAIIALIVAVCSLLWNIISTVHSWQLDRPRVRTEASFQQRGPRDYWLELILRNSSKSTAIIESIEVKVRSNKTSLAFSIDVPQELDTVSGESSSRLGEEGAEPSPGPHPPLALEQGQAQHWNIDLVEFLGSTATRITTSNFALNQLLKQLIIEVGLGSGKTIRKQYKISKFLDLPHMDTIVDAYSKRLATRSPPAIRNYNETDSSLDN